MARTRTFFEGEPSGESQRAERTPEVTDSVRRSGFVHAFAGLLGLVGPAVRNDDDKLLNTDPGLFLGRVAVNGPHAMFHVLWGLLALDASRDDGSARRHAGLSAVVFGTLAAVGFRRFGFERGVHLVAGLAIDGWGNLGHAIVSALGVRTALRSRERS